MERDSFAFASETWGFKEGGDPKLNLSAFLQKKNSIPTSGFIFKSDPNWKTIGAQRLSWWDKLITTHAQKINKYIYKKKVEYAKKY